VEYIVSKKDLKRREREDCDGALVWYSRGLGMRGKVRLLRGGGRDREAVAGGDWAWQEKGVWGAKGEICKLCSEGGESGVPVDGRRGVVQRGLLWGKMFGGGGHGLDGSRSVAEDYFSRGWGLGFFEKEEEEWGFVKKKNPNKKGSWGIRGRGVLSKLRKRFKGEKYGVKIGKWNHRRKKASHKSNCTNKKERGKMLSQKKNGVCV